MPLAKKAMLLAVCLILLSLLLALAAFPFLPEKIAVQWNLQGEVTNTMGSWMVFLFPLLSGGITVLNVFQNPIGTEKRVPWISVVMGILLLLAQLFIVGTALHWW